MLCKGGKLLINAAFTCKDHFVFKMVPYKICLFGMILNADHINRRYTRMSGIYRPYPFFTLKSGKTCCTVKETFYTIFSSIPWIDFSLKPIRNLLTVTQIDKFYKEPSMRSRCSCGVLNASNRGRNQIDVIL